MHEDSSLFASYASVAKRYRPLTREEEYALSHRLRGGDAHARELMIRHNVAYVLSIAGRWAASQDRIDDYIQEGMYGLLKAVDRFDPAKGNRFSTYASWWIRAYVRKFVHQNRSAIHRPAQKPGEQRQPFGSDSSLDAPIGDEDGDAMIDLLEAGDELADEAAIRSARKAEIAADLARLKKRIGGLGMDIVERRLKTGKAETLEQIGDDWGLSRERVRQVETVTKRILARALARFNEEIED